MLQDALILSFENITDSWVVDSGASFHATPDKKYFHHYVQGDFGQVSTYCEWITMSGGQWRVGWCECDGVSGSW